MQLKEQFSDYMVSCPSQEARAYLIGRFFPALDALERKGRRARSAQIWLTAAMMLMALVIPVLLLLPYALNPAVIHLCVSGLCILIAAILFAQQLLHLPTLAAASALKQRELCALLHAYFLGAGEFAALDGEQRLKLLYTQAEWLLA